MTSIFRRSAFIRMSAPEKETCRRAAAISAGSSAAWRSGRRLDWFTERAAWDPYQQYQGATNLLTTKLTSRHGPIQVVITDFAAIGECLPLNAGREKSPGQYIKRFLIRNEGTEATAGDFRRLCAGGDQRRCRRRRPELARHRPVSAGDQSRPRPCQSQAGPGCNDRVRPGT